MTDDQRLEAIRRQYEPCPNGPDCKLHPVRVPGDMSHRPRTTDDTDARLAAPDLFESSDTDPRTPLDALTDDVLDYLAHRDMRANDLDGAETDARALGFASHAERTAAARATAVRSLYAVTLAAIDDHGTDAAWEAERSDLDDDDLTGGRSWDADDLSGYIAQLIITLRDAFTADR